jgi:FtsP/CotA-like multicopper oxidase with cupredoxin domain
LHISLDNHTFTVVGADFNPIIPYNTTNITMAIGQRYDVIINANQPSDSYWFRVSSGLIGCDGGINPNVTVAKAVFQYTTSGKNIPTSQGITNPTGCYDEPPFQMYRAQTVPPKSPNELLVNFGPSNTVPQVFWWTINGNALFANWTYPLLAMVRDHNANYPARANVQNVSNTGWTYWVVQQDPNILAKIPHPIHLHGHDYWVIAQGTGNYTTATLNWDNAVRRDTATLPAGGYLILAFKTDNPGTWLMHCHIAFHADGGFGMSFVERLSDMQSNFDFSQLKAVCDPWHAYGNTDEASISGI